MRSNILRNLLVERRASQARGAEQTHKHSSGGNLAMVEITIETGEFDSLPDDIVQYGNQLIRNVDAVMEYWARQIRDWLEWMTPKGETGITAASWIVVPTGSPGEFFITNTNEPIATYLTMGTSAHWVGPVFARALHWVDETGDHFSMGHWVRGIIGYDFVTEVLDMLQPDIDADIAAAEEAAWREIA
jgi:hypothetical protein